jgi:hypothetical protein
MHRIAAVLPRTNIEIDWVRTPDSAPLFKGWKTKRFIAQPSFWSAAF